MKSSKYFPRAAVLVFASLPRCFINSAATPALSDASSALVGEGSNVEALLSWVENYKRSSEVEATCLSALDSSLTVSELVTNMEQLLALEKDTIVADRLWAGDEIRSIAEQAVG